MNECHDPEHLEAMKHLGAIMDTEEELENAQDLIRRQADILRGIANALHGARWRTAGGLTTTWPS